MMNDLLMCVKLLLQFWMCVVNIIVTSKMRDYGSRVMTTAASQGLEVGQSSGGSATPARSESGAPLSAAPTLGRRWRLGDASVVNTQPSLRTSNGALSIEKRVRS